jgi:8-amino-7-oxononanoate synthase
MERRIREYLDKRGEVSLLRELRTCVPVPGGRVRVDGTEYVNFSSNDYLGLAEHPELSAAVAAAPRNPSGSSASRLMTGTHPIHERLEKEVALFKGKPEALIFNSGYAANTGIISALVGRDDTVFADRAVHASIIDGIRLSGARLRRYRHNDALHLERLLKRYRPLSRGALIVTESVFSMDGDTAPLARIAGLKREFDCCLMVDEAHATGIYGHNGSGMAEEQGVTGEVDIIMGTFGKALGSFGAYAAMNALMKDYLVNTCRSFIYSTAMPPSVSATSLKAVELIAKEPGRRADLLERTGFLRRELEKRGFSTAGNTQIIPIVTGCPRKALDICEKLRSHGFWAAAVRPPTVAPGGSRLRISLSSCHSYDDLKRFLDILEGCDHA